MFRHVVLAVDGSEPARRAATVGLDLAAAAGSDVDVVCAVPPDWDGDADRASTAVDAVAADAADRGLTAETYLVEGAPHRAIIDFAESRGADLVVMGREGRGGLTERLLGSTTERVLRGSDVPVLVVPRGDRPLPADYDRVLVTTDGSDAAERAGPYAVDVAGEIGAALHVLSVVDVQGAAGVFDAGGVSREYVDRLRDRAAAATERIATDADVTVTRATVRGRPHEGIREYVDEEGIDLVVLSSTGQSNLSGQQLGSTAGRLLRVLDVPVLVVTG